MSRGSGLSKVIFAIGDVHGRYDLLQNFTARCLEHAAERACATPLFVFLGDYM